MSDDELECCLGWGKDCNGVPICIVGWECVSAPPNAPKPLSWNDRYGIGGGTVIGVERRKLFDFMN